MKKSRPMNTPLKNKKDIQQAFKDLLTTASTEEKVELEALVLSAKFLSEIQRVCQERDILKKDLAEMIGTSPSHVTQLFRGNKTINLKTIARLQLELGVSFDIKLSGLQTDEMQTLNLIQPLHGKNTPEGLWVFKPRKKATNEEVSIKVSTNEQMVA